MRPFQSHYKKAEALLKNKARLSQTLKRAATKALRNKQVLRDSWKQLQLFFALIRDYANGTYTSIPKRSMVGIVATVVYFLIPTDLIPDVLPALGLLDDLSVLTFMVRQVGKDLEKYQQWREENPSVKSELTAS